MNYQMLEEHISITGYTGNMKLKASKSPPVYAFRGKKPTEIFMFSYGNALLGCPARILGYSIAEMKAFEAMGFLIQHTKKD